jgi:hypothetical protein
LRIEDRSGWLRIGDDGWHHFDSQNLARIWAGAGRRLDRVFRIAQEVIIRRRSRWEWSR